MTSLPARAYRRDLPSGGLPGSLQIDGAGARFEGEGLELEIPTETLQARVGGLDEGTLFLADRRHPGLELAIDRQRAESLPALAGLPAVTGALQRGRARRRRFWACAAALAAVLLVFLVMVLALGGLIVRALTG